MNKIQSKKIKRNAIVLGTLFIVGVAMPHFLPVQAQEDSNLDYIASVVAWLLLLVVQFFGKFLTVLSGLLINIAQYNSFGSEEFVIRAWVVVRDFANIFFIIALLLIAIATILRIEVYSAKRLLFKLVLMSVLINFSRSIAILIVNISQVIMLFFINAFASVQGLLLTNILLLDEYLTLSQNAEQLATFDISGLIGNVLLAGVFIAIGTFVVGAFIIMLAYRIVFLWLLIILSPLAFLLHAIPGGTSYASRWWGTFSKNVISGPILAFFLWLAFFSVSPTVGSAENFAAQYFLDPNAPTPASANASSITAPDNLLSFIVGVGLLVGGLLITAQIGAAGASVASGAVSRMQRAGTATARGARSAALGSARGVSSAVGITSRAQAGRKAISQVPLARMVTKQGREEKRLEKEDKAGKGFFGGYQTQTDAGRKLEKAYEADGRAEDYSFRQNMMESKGLFTRRPNKTKRDVGHKLGLKKGDPGTTNKIYDGFDPATASQQEFKQLLDKEAIAAKENKQFAGRVKVGDDGKLGYKEDPEYRTDLIEKLNNQKPQEIQKASTALLKDTKKVTESGDQPKASELVDKYLAYDPDGSNMKFNVPAMRAQLDGIVELATNNKIQISPEDLVELGNKHNRLATHLSEQTEGKERRAPFSAQIATSGATPTVSAAMNRIGVDRRALQKPTTSLYQAARGVGAGRHEALSGRRDEMNTIFDAYKSASTAQASGVANPEGGEFSYEQLVDNRKDQANENFNNYDVALEDLNTAKERLASAEEEGNQGGITAAQADIDRAEGVINEAVASIESEIENLATPEFATGRDDFEASSERVDEFRTNIADNRQTLIDVSNEPGMGVKEKKEALDDVFAHIPQSMKALSKSYEDTIGLDESQEALQAEILQKVDDLSLRDKGRMSNDELTELASSIKRFEDSLS